MASALDYAETSLLSRIFALFAFCSFMSGSDVQGHGHNSGKKFLPLFWYYVARVVCTEVDEVFTVVQAVLATLYFMNAVSKVLKVGWRWADGFNLRNVLLRDLITLKRPNEFLVKNIPLLRMLSVLTILFQISMPLVFSHQSLRFVLVCMAFSFHAGIYIHAQVNFFVHWVPFLLSFCVHTRFTRAVIGTLTVYWLGILYFAYHYFLRVGRRRADSWKVGYLPHVVELFLGFWPYYASYYPFPTLVRVEDKWGNLIRISWRDCYVNKFLGQLLFKHYDDIEEIEKTLLARSLHRPYILRKLTWDGGNLTEISKLNFSLRPAGDNLVQASYHS